jgi:hypothetical protein
VGVGERVLELEALPLKPDLANRKRKPVPPPRGDPTESKGGHAHDMTPPDGSTDSSRAHEAVLQGQQTERELECALPMRGDLAAHRPNWPPREGATKHAWPPQKTPHEGAPTILKARATFQPKDKSPWEAIPESRRPSNTSNVSSGHHYLP